MIPALSDVCIWWEKSSLLIDLPILLTLPLYTLVSIQPNTRDGFGGSTPQSKDNHQSKPSTSKVSQSEKRTTQPSAESRQPGSNQQQSENPKKPSSSLTIAEYKHKREKELLQNKQTGTPTPGEGSRDKPSAPKAVHSGAPPAHPQHQSHPQKTTAPRPGHLDSRPATSAASGSNPALKALLAGSQPAKHEKIHPKTTNFPHRRPDKTHHATTQKPQPQQPASIPGLQRPKHPTNPASSHGTPQQHKENTKGQNQHHQRHPGGNHTKPAPPRPKEHLPAKAKEQQAPVSEFAKIKSHPAMSKSASEIDDNFFAGLEQKVMENIKADKESSQKTSEVAPFARPQGSSTQPTATVQPNPQTKEHKSRQSLPNLPSSNKEMVTGHPQPLPPATTYKALYEEYKKNPEVLRQQLKLKVQNEPLTEEEKQIWRKLKKKEEERLKKKRKHERHKLNRSQPIESHKGAEGGNVTPGGGPLTVRIKLPPSVRAEISKNQASTSSSGSGLAIGSSSGSASEALTSSPSGTLSKPGRKRTHVNDSSGLSDPISAKHSRKSEGHHHQSHHSSHESSRHRHRHGHSGSHHRHSKSQHPGHKIDEATFQQALVDAVTMVQSGQTGPGTNASEEAVPTVTLKRTGNQNGSGEYTTHSRHDKHKSSRHGKQHGFDPSLPVSATPPEDLFDGEASNEDNHATLAMKDDDADLSPLETGEIRDDEDDASPLREHVSTSRSNYHQKDLYSQRSHAGANNNNNISSHHHQQQWGALSGSGGHPHPPSLTRASGQHGKLEGHRNYDNRLPPMPNLSVKPNRSEQR